MNDLRANLRIALEAMPPLDELASLWTGLELRAQASVFTSWSLIGTWIRALPLNARPHLLVARHQGEIVGLAILVEGAARSLRMLRTKSWFLHCTGDAEHDGICSEYNGFLLDRRAPPSLAAAMLGFLLSRHTPGRLEITSAQSSLVSLAHKPPPGLLAQVRERRSYMVSLDDVREHRGDYLGMLSSNSRSQIRRSMKAYEALGPLRLDIARDRGTALQFLDRLMALHAQRWEDKGVASHFARAPIARRFHERLIDEAFDQGIVQLIKVSAGEHEVGYLYNLVYQGRVAYYQSGLNFGLLDKHDRPGLVAHTLAVQHNLALGHQWYDFMAGDYRYKASMSTHIETQAWCRFESDGLTARLEHLVRRGHSMARRLVQGEDQPWSTPTDEPPVHAPAAVNGPMLLRSVGSALSTCAAYIV